MPRLLAVAEKLLKCLRINVFKGVSIAMAMKNGNFYKSTISFFVTMTNRFYALFFYM
jgi:hypothetical protein